MNRVPNLDTLSTYIDRLVIENVKKAIFELRCQDEENLSDADLVDLGEKIMLQEELIEACKKKITDDLLAIVGSGKYEYKTEARTFK